MKFATIMREARISTKKHEKVAQIPITLFDGKDRNILDEDVHFVEPLFQKNPSSYNEFLTFLAYLEKRSDIESINVKIDENAVIVLYKTPLCRIFLRKPINTMD